MSIDCPVWTVWEFQIILWVVIVIRWYVEGLLDILVVSHFSSPCTSLDVWGELREDAAKISFDPYYISFDYYNKPIKLMQFLNGIGSNFAY